jgi:hypothetical protein
MTIEPAAMYFKISLSARIMMIAWSNGWRCKSSPLRHALQQVVWQHGGSDGRQFMITGAHSIIFSANPEADRAFLRDVLGLPHVDVGDGWLIFGLPPAEVAVHPSDNNGAHQLYLMCHDVEALAATMALRSIETTEVRDEGWGLITDITLPGGGKLPVYQPRHERPAPMTAAKRRAGKKKAVKKVGKKASKKVTKAPKVVKRGAPPARRKKGKAPKRR